jgi:WD40 repeat protein
MLISCFQCRQQLDVPEDSAGKRVQCPHCRYVIVVPANSRPAETEAPATALPSMELDAEGEKGMPVTRIAPQPLPPFDLPPEPAKWQPEQPKPASEDMPAPPSIDKGSRRRLMAPAPAAKRGWGRIGVIGMVLGAVVLGALVVFSSHNRRRVPVKVPVHQHQFQFHGFNNQGNNPQGQGLPAIPDQQWVEFRSVEHRFKAQFPGRPASDEILPKPRALAAYTVDQFDWEFTVAHLALTDADYRSVPVEERLDRLQRDLENYYGAQAMTAVLEQVIPLPNVRAEREWSFSMFGAGQRRVFVQALLLRRGGDHHLYVLAVRVPMNIVRNNASVQRFFTSFTVSMEDTETAFEELDAVANGVRRDNEFTALALHPSQPIAVVGAIVSQATISGPGGQRQFPVAVGKPIDQIATSPNGEWVALVVGGRIVCWQDWSGGMPQQKFVDTGVHCAFTGKNHLLVADKDGIAEMNMSPLLAGARLPIPDLAIKGFALSGDDKTLAVFGAKAIELWDWSGKKKLGRLENAHAAAVTAVAFAPDGKTLASASADRTIKLWDVATRAERAVLKQHAWTVWTLAFAPDGKHLVSGGLDGMLLVWDVQPRQPALVWAQAHQFPVRGAAFDADGKNLYFTCKQPLAGDAGGARQYVRQLRKLAWTDIKPNTQEAERIVAERAGLHLPAAAIQSYFSRSGEIFVSTTDGIDNFAVANSLRVWDTKTGTLRHSQAMLHHGVLSADGKWFVFSPPGGPNELHLLDVPASRANRALVFAGNGFPQVMFAPDSKSLWVRINGKFVRHEIQAFPNGDATLVPREPVIEDADMQNAANVIHPGRGQTTFLVERYVDGIARARTVYSSADGKKLAVKAGPGQWSDFLRLRRMPQDKQIEVFDLLYGHSQTIGQQRFQMGASALDPQRKYAATTENPGNEPSRVNLWDVQARRPLLTVPEPRVTAIRFSPDGRWMGLVTPDWTRIVPIDWLLERQGLLRCPPNEVVGP